jgi:hypothetical protein
MSTAAITGLASLRVADRYLSWAVDVTFTIAKSLQEVAVTCYDGT